MKNKHKKSGFSLIELLVAIAILATVYVTISILMTKSLSSSLSAQDRSRARNYLQQAMENLRIQRDGEDDWANFIDTASCTFNPTAVPTPPDTKFSMGITPAPVVGESDCSNKAKFTVEVNWANDTISGETYFSNTK